MNKLIPRAKSGIHIKKENRGKFKAAAKRAGMSVQQYASHVLSNPNAPSYLKKRANFARNAAKWKHKDGGVIKYQLGGNFERILDRFRKSDKDFAIRMRDPNRLSIPDWENTSKIATHKLGVGTDSKGNHYVYPEVQNINGQLVDFTRPPYKQNAGRISAEQRGDTIRVPSIESGLEFTQKYKQYFPSFNKH